MTPTISSGTANRESCRARGFSFILLSVMLIATACHLGPKRGQALFIMDSFVADFSGPSSDWSLEGYWTISGGELLHDLTPGTEYGLGDARLEGRLWTAPVIETQFVVEEFGLHGALRIMFGWQDRYVGYGLTFNEGGTVLYRFDGSWDQNLILGQSGFRARAGEQHRVQIAVDANRIQVFVDGEEIMRTSDPDALYEAGYVGIKASNFIRARVRAWSVQGPMKRVPPLYGAPVAPPDRPRSEPYITGTFLQLDATTVGWTKEQWRREFAAMQAIGIDTLLLQDVANESRKAVYYPSDALIGEYTVEGEGRIVQTLLDEAAAHGMEVWLGLYRHGGWASRLAEDLIKNKQVIEELVALYGDHPAFVGWYVTNEVIMSDAGPVSSSWIAHIAAITEHARATSPERPVAVAPGLRLSAWLDSEAALIYWEEFLRGTGVDVVMLQDGMGLAWRNAFTPWDLVPHYRAMQIAADRAGVALWNDLENFVTRDWQAADTERVLAQLQAVAPFVEKTVIFEFNHYMSPVRAEPLLKTGSTAAQKMVALYNGYQAYLAGW